MNCISKGRNLIGHPNCGGGIRLFIRQTEWAVMLKLREAEFKKNGTKSIWSYSSNVYACVQG
jgi:hypothetical protein